MTLAEVAEELGVHYMTAYRYVRIGKLPARRVGREWRVDPADLATMREPATDAWVSVRWDDRLDSRVRAYDEQGSWQVIESAMASGHGPVAVYTELIIPVLRQLGEDWAAGRMGVAEEHAATSICRRLVGRLGLLSARPGVSKGLVIFACAPGDTHCLASTIAADIFRAGGYDVIDCGRDLPVPSLADLAAGAERLMAVGISSTQPDNHEETARMVAALKARLPDTPVIVGGAGITSLSPGRTLGADILATTALEGLAQLGQWGKVDPGID